MGKYKIKFSTKWTRKSARKALPLFASFFLAQFPVPAGNISEKLTMPVISATPEAMKIVDFELELYKLYEEAGLQASGLDLEVFNKALVGYLNLKHIGTLTENKLLTIVDFDKPSSEKRLWVIDLKARKILFHSLVSHGKNSGWSKADKFSNTPSSNMSSLGFYITKDTYQGKHGLSLKLEGQDENYNTNAASRSIVVHGADYVSDAFLQKNGYLGRSQGCPALPMENHAEIISAIKEGTCLFLHASAAEYTSPLLDTEVALNTYFGQNQSI